MNLQVMGGVRKTGAAERIQIASESPVRAPSVEPIFGVGPCLAATSTSQGFPASPYDLNPSNRRMRTRTSGGVAGATEANPGAPMPMRHY